jgi:hypothetical protein
MGYTMPPQHPEVPPEILRQELLRLRSAVAEGRRASSRQRRSELAALLFEAHRADAYRAWGYQSLGRYARSELGMQPATFAKYKAAGKALHETVLYERLIEAVRQDQPRPPLQDVSELAAAQSLEKQMGSRRATVALLDEGASLSKVKSLAEMSAYGDAGSEARRILGELDSFVQGVRRGKMILRGLLAGAEGVSDHELQLRLSRVREECEGAIRIVALLATGE